MYVHMYSVYKVDYRGAAAPKKAGLQVYPNKKAGIQQLYTDRYLYTGMANFYEYWIPPSAQLGDDESLSCHPKF